jgi:hypothetical protein
MLPHALLPLLQDATDVPPIDATLLWTFIAGACVVGIFMIASVWKVHTKAGESGWSCLIPIYNAWIWIRIARKPGWWLLLLLIPLVNIVVAFMLNNAVARNFGKSTAFGVGISLLGFIFIPILAWGDAAFSA